MNLLTRSATAGIAAVIVAVPTVALIASPASADTEKHVSCAGGHLELSVDNEAGGWEVDAQVDNVAANQKWRIVLKHDGNRYFKGVRTTDYEGDVDVDRFRSDSSGSDRFSMKAVRLSDGTTCSGSVTVG
jgi:hypothetical protein